MELIKRTAIRKEYQSGARQTECSRLFAIVTSRLLKFEDGRKKAVTTIELCGGKVDKNDKVRWSNSVKEFTTHEELIIDEFNKQAYCLLWHNTAVDLMSNVAEGVKSYDITAYGDD